MNNLSRILVISFSPLSRDPRVLRQLNSLRKNYHVTVAGYGSPNINVDIEIDIALMTRSNYAKIRDSILMLIGLSRIYYWYYKSDVLEVVSKTKNLKFDMVLSNDFDSLPVALRLAGNKPVFLDAHEFTPDEVDKNLWIFLPIRIYKKWLVKKHISKVEMMSTVSSGIAELYVKNFNVKKPILIPNATDFVDLEPSTNFGKKIRLVHHGLASKSRGIEILINSMGFVKKSIELHLILVGDQIEIERIKNFSKNNSRIFFHEPVSVSDIPRFINQFDLGVFILPPFTSNHKYVLPNKFFEFVQARLGVIIGPSPDMERYVKHFGLGLITDGFTEKDLVKQLDGISFKMVNKFKFASHNAADELCWEKFEYDFLQGIQACLANIK
jgi:hypothetical protein